MNWLRISVALFCVCGLVLAVGGMANAEGVDSSAFTWKYEFEDDTADTPDNLDIDGNSYPDMMAYGSPDGTLADGIMTLSQGSYIDDFGWKPELENGIWKANSFSAANGFTIEARIKVISSTGSYGATMIGAGPEPQAGAPDSWLNIGGSEMVWSTNSPKQVLSTGNNTNDFHIFRLALNPTTSSYDVWRDGVQVGSSLPDAYSPSNNGLDRLYLGNISSLLAGTTQWDYVRFTEGYFEAPAPESMPQMNSSAFNWKYEFEGTTADTPDNLDVDGNGHPDMMLFGDAGPGTVADGVMTLSSYAVDDAVYGTSYIDDFDWKPTLTDGIWKSHDFSGGFTIEARIKVNDDAGLYGATSIAAGGTDLSTGLDTWINVAANGVYLFGSSATPIAPELDNTDGFHVFRVAVDSATGRASLWRDGDLLVENLPDIYSDACYKRIYIGDITASTNGTVEYDYIRITDGAYAPVPEPSTLVLLLAGFAGSLACAWRKRK